MNDRERLELAEVFSSVLDSRLKSLYREMVGMVVEILDQHAKDFATVMEGSNNRTMERFAQMRAKRERDVYEVRTREQQHEQRVSESIGFAAKGPEQEGR